RVRRPEPDAVRPHQRPRCRGERDRGMRHHRALCLSAAALVWLGGVAPSIAQPPPSPSPGAAEPSSDYNALRMSGFLVGSVSYNSKLQMVPEFAGGTPALSNP